MKYSKKECHFMTQKPLFVNFSKQNHLIGEIRRNSALYDRSNTLGGHSLSKRYNTMLYLMTTYYITH